MQYNGYLTQYIRKFIGLKGLSLLLTWLGIFLGIIPFDYPSSILIASLCGLKVTEDVFNLQSNKS